MHSQLESGEPKCVVVFFRPRLTLGEMTTWPKDRLFAFGEPYSSIAGEKTGFYAWVRDTDGKLLGIRYWPFESAEFVTSRAAKLEYVQISERRHIEIFFSNERRVCQELSKHQDFLYDPVFVSPAGECALAFSTDNPSEADYRSLSASDAEWVAI